METYPPILDQLDRGPPARVAPAGGGCIAQSAVATFADGSRAFVKRLAGKPSMFECEAAGLRALHSANAIRIPRVLAVSPDALVLEYIEQGSQGSGFFADFGRRFARLHECRGKTCGFPHDNFIGSTPQRNDPVVRDSDVADNLRGQDWPEFFIQRRLRFQAELAIQNGHGSELAGLLDRSESTITEILSHGCESPSLLHGDLWGGNFMVDEDGEPCLIDPAVYYGHREADLAMTHLFGGFGADFYSTYNEALPLAAGWEERLPIYQLYHLLNHLNLFGRAYYARSMAILQRY